MLNIDASFPCYFSITARRLIRLLILFANRRLTIENRQSHGVLAQLVERLNGIEEVRGSNPLGSNPFWQTIQAIALNFVLQCAPTDAEFFSRRAAIGRYLNESLPN